MKVKELIAELEKMPPDAEVSTEGCDCYGDVEKVTFHESSVRILLWRDRDKVVAVEPACVVLERSDD